MLLGEEAPAWSPSPGLLGFCGPQLTSLLPQVEIPPRGAQCISWSGKPIPVLVVSIKGLCWGGTAILLLQRFGI